MTNPLAGKLLRYLIGADSPGTGHDGEITMVPYGEPPVPRGISAGYCNLFDEQNTGRYGPYLRDSDTAKEYDEGQIDPRGPGWNKNLTEQFWKRRHQGFNYIELDNPDAYSFIPVESVINIAADYGLKVIAKNPGLFEREYDQRAFVRHPNIYGIICEKGAGSARSMDDLRRNAGKTELPVWFVAFGDGRIWANKVAKTAKNYHNMGVTYSAHGEYTDSIDILKPRSL